MIRVIAICSALAMAAIVLYLPAANPPERFIQQLRHENALNVEFWGDAVGHRILARMLDYEEAFQSKTPGAAVGALRTTADSAMGNAVAGEVGKVSERLMNNRYFKSIDTLTVLALYRLASLVEWLPLFAILGVALISDGLVGRILRSREFVQHNPEMFAASAIVFMLAMFGLILALVLPQTIHPYLFGFTLLLGGIGVRGIVANYHRAG